MFYAATEKYALECVFVYNFVSHNVTFFAPAWCIFGENIDNNINRMFFTK